MRIELKPYLTSDGRPKVAGLPHYVAIYANGLEVGCCGGPGHPVCLSERFAEEHREEIEGVVADKFGKQPKPIQVRLK